ncbi:MAG: hypothetical protein BRC32_02335 [Actinobacteria bacterium QS_8_72_14]|nr:MAG: hypothetical protein BRC32_02335 [Actinobacteria bacterium QS_8_72_14]
MGVVDPVRLARLLQRLGEQLAILRDRAAEDRAALRADEARLSPVLLCVVGLLGMVSPSITGLPS